MKAKLLALLLCAAMVLSLPAYAAAPMAGDFSGGALSGIAADGDALLVTDTYNKVVWRLEKGSVTRFAGQIGLPGLDGEPIGQYIDGAPDTAQFLEPWAIAPYLDGWAVSDASANVIRYIDARGVRTAAGSGRAGFTNSTGTKASFDRPTGLAAAPDGSLYIADTGNGAIRRLDKNGRVTTVLSGLCDPTGLCWFDGSLYVAETGRSRILRITDGKPEVLAGDSLPLEDGEYEGGYVDGPVEKARFDHPQGVAVAEDGTVYIADTGNHAVRRLADDRVATMARGGQSLQPPVQPRGLLLQEDTLLVTDLFAQSLLSLSTQPPCYADVAEDSPNGEVVRLATERGLVVGTGGGLFSPDAPATRAMCVVMLSRLHQGTDGSAVMDGSASFSDVPEGAWYASAVRWAADRQILFGAGGCFYPSDGVTREALAAMVYRYAASAGYDVSARADLAAFPDAAALSSYAEEPMSWAAALGLLGGDGTLSPRSVVSRSEAAALLLAFMAALGL